MTLTEFLLARIAEDRESIRGDWAGGDRELHILSEQMHERLLAETDAKRAILDLTERGCGDDYERVRKALALPYAAHPDYREEWRP